MEYTLEFEKSITELESQIKDLKESNKNSDIDLSKEIKALEKKVDGLVEEVYAGLTPWERVLLSRHPHRPHTIYYIENLITDFHEIHGDRKNKDDLAIIGGFGYFEGKKVAVIGIEKGNKTNEKVLRNFGMPYPDGYRKALRIMQMASRFNIPIITFVDTPGAYPGTIAEEKGQAEAIATNLMEIFGFNSPIISVVIGEGGSGGALGIAIADHVFMMEYSVYSVISPESCASILWSDPGKAEIAANALDLGPIKALEMGIIDGIIPEPKGGAHREPSESLKQVKLRIEKSLNELAKIDSEVLKNNRFDKFRKMGNQYLENF